VTTYSSEACVNVDYAGLIISGTHIFPLIYHMQIIFCFW